MTSKMFLNGSFGIGLNWLTQLSAIISFATGPIELNSYTSVHCQCCIKIVLMLKYSNVLGSKEYIKYIHHHEISQLIN